MINAAKIIFSKQIDEFMAALFDAAHQKATIDY